MSTGSPTVQEFPSPEADPLVERAIEGDTEAFAELFRLAMPIVHRMMFARCRDAALADDLTQDAFIRAMRAIGTSFQGRSNEFLAWVLRIARNRFLDHVKSGRVKWEVAVDDLPLAVSRADTEMEAMSVVEGEAVRRAMEHLTDDQREVLEARFLRGRSIAEVAEAAGRSEGAIKALQFRALRSLAKILARERESQPISP